MRLARDADVPGLEKLIPLSVRALQARYYSTAQMDGALGFGSFFLVAGWRKTLPQSRPEGPHPPPPPSPTRGGAGLILLPPTGPSSAIERYDVPLANGLGLPIVRMIKNFVLN